MLIGEKKNYWLLLNIVLLNIIIFIFYFSNIKSLLEVYNFPYKQDVLEQLNKINLDTTSFNDSFIGFKKKVFNKEEVQENTENNIVDVEKMPNNENPVSSLNAIMVSDESLNIDKIMIAGDSMAQSLEFGLRDLYPKRIENKARHSTGLTVPSYFNWEKGLTEYLEETKRANVLIFMVGANDAQDLFVNKKYLKFGSEDWKQEYKNRVKKILNIIDSHEGIKRVLWIGQPIMRNKSFDQKMDILNSAYQESIQELNNKKVKFIPTKELLAVNGEYSAEINRKLARASDGIHMSSYGTFLIAEKIKEDLENSN